MNKILQLAHDSIHRHQGLALVTAVFVAQGDDCAQLLLQLRRGAEVAGLIMSLPRELAGHWQKKRRSYRHVEVAELSGFY